MNNYVSTYLIEYYYNKPDDEITLVPTKKVNEVIKHFIKQGYNTKYIWYPAFEATEFEA
jgi:hypothetical protein